MVDEMSGNEKGVGKTESESLGRHSTWVFQKSHEFDRILVFLLLRYRRAFEVQHYSQ
jgi:hypothetical protein